MAYSPKNPNGQDTMADSEPVVIASDQSAIPVSATDLDVRNLSSLQDSVEVKQATGTNLHTVVDSGTVTTVSTVTNLSQLGGAAVPIGAGLEATAVRVTLPTDGTGKVSVVQATATNLKVQAETYQGGSAVAAGNPLQVSLANTAANSTAVKVDASSVAVPVTDNSGSLTVDYATTGSGTATGALRVELPTNGTGVVGLNTGTNTIGSVIPVPSTSGGLSVAMMSSADGSTALTSTAQAIKASAGQLFGYYIYNPNTSATYVPIYNTAAASVTVGTTNPLMLLCIPASSAANCSFEHGITFSNAGWSVAATTTGGGNSAPSTALEAMFFYK